MVILLHISAFFGYLKEVFNTEKYITVHLQSDSNYYDT